MGDKQRVLWYFPKWPIENIKKSFFRLKIYAFLSPKQSHFKLKLACFEHEKTEISSKFEEFSGLNPFSAHTEPAKNKIKFCIIYTLRWAFF